MSLLSVSNRIMIKSADLNVMYTAVTRAARSMIRDFGELEHLQASRKAPGDFVTRADRKAEKILTETLAKARPDYGFLCEERGVQEAEHGDQRIRWIIDPLDGTVNFMHAIDHFCISVALEVDGRVQAALIYDPISDEMYYAEAGSGAYCNDKRLRIAGRRDIDACIILFSLPHNATRAVLEKAYASMMDVECAHASIRRTGSAALGLCMLAAGRADGYVAHDLAPWDCAAGLLIAREAGAFVSSHKGQDVGSYQGDLVLGNEVIHPQLQRMIQGVARQ